ncbi:opsin 6, group member b [Coregonus clupeaformis]|uniref:opsin 6, group member b n=1 Tax=Coregonus clupeaformis TaxID=59861 RepID=UPI001BDFC043|nr:opsin 6, group member b [Coregonus clupeaformis]
MEDSDIFRPNVSVYMVSAEGETAIGVYLLILEWLSCLGNGVVILLLVKQRHRLQPQDFLTLNLAVSDAGVAIFGYSRGILEVFNVFRDDGLLIKTIWTCQVDGFLIMLFGLISINTLTAISVIRYIKGCQPSYAHYINQCNVAVVIVAVWLCALFWSGAPLVGWGSYTARKYGMCEIDWVQARFSVSYRLYVILIFTFNFFIPFVVIWFSYVSIIRAVNNSHKSSRGGEVSEREKQMERSITTVSLILCSSFLLAWSPYAVISMWSACGHQVPPLHSILASLFAKSASFYNPFIYLGMSSKFRQDFRAQFHCLRPNPDLSHRPDEVQIDLDIMEVNGGVDDLDSGVELGIDRGVEERGENQRSPLMPPMIAPAPSHRLFLRKLSDSGRL